MCDSVDLLRIYIYIFY